MLDQQMTEEFGFPVVVSESVPKNCILVFSGSLPLPGETKDEYMDRLAKESASIVNLGEENAR